MTTHILTEAEKEAKYDAERAGTLYIVAPAAQPAGPAVVFTKKDDEGWYEYAAGTAALDVENGKPTCLAFGGAYIELTPAKMEGFHDLYTLLSDPTVRRLLSIAPAVTSAHSFVNDYLTAAFRRFSHDKDMPTADGIALMTQVIVDACADEPPPTSTSAVRVEPHISDDDFDERNYGKQVGVYFVADGAEAYFPDEVNKLNYPEILFRDGQKCTSIPLSDIDRYVAETEAQMRGLKVLLNSPQVKAARVRVEAGAPLKAA